MAYGIKIWDSNGGVAINLSTNITRIIDSFKVSSGSTGSKGYSAQGLSNSKGAAFAVLSSQLASRPDVQHRVWISGSTVHWDDMAAGNYKGDSYIFVVMYK